MSACSPIKTVTPEEMDFPSVFIQDAQQNWPVSWWQTFNDVQLNQYVEQALLNNYSLQAAAARVAQSSSLLSQQRSNFIPELDANLGRTRNWQESGSSGPSASNNWSAGLSASYEVDLWGSIRASSQQAEFNVSASQAAYRTLANTVAAQVSSAWLGLRKETENLALLVSQQERTSKSLQVIERRQAKGQSSLTDVLQQMQLQESLDTQVIAAQAQQQIYLQQLALWTGQSQIAPMLASDAPYLTNGSMNLVPVDSVALEALKARPDVQQAYHQLEAASAGVALAVTNRYPRFSLAASYTGKDENLNQIFDNWVASLAGSLVLPLIDGGQRKAEVKRQQAIEQEALANYQQTLLEAAQEVQQALVLDNQYALTVTSLSEQLQLAQQTLDLSNSYYLRGQTNYLSLLNAQQDVLGLEQQLLTAQWNHTQARIQLYQAVSHGYFQQQRDKKPESNPSIGGSL